MSVFIQKDPSLQTSDLLSSLGIELERVRYAHDLVLVSNSGEEVATSARLFGLWSPLVRVLAPEGGRILLPDFPFSALTRLPTLLIPGWAEEVLTKEEVQVLKALDIPIIDPTGNSVTAEVKLEPVEAPEMSYHEPQVEIKEESSNFRRPAKTHQPAADQPASREVQIGRIRTGIAKIEKVEPGRRSKSQQLSLKVLTNYLQELMAQEGVTDENSKGNILENANSAHAQESQNVTFLSCEHCTTKFPDRRSLNMHKENDCKSKNGVSENGKNTVIKSFNTDDAMAKKVEVPMKPKSLLKDCDLCQMKFLNDRSLMMHKKTEH